MIEWHIHHQYRVGVDPYIHLRENRDHAHTPFRGVLDDTSLHTLSFIKIEKSDHVSMNLVFLTIISDRSISVK